MEKLPKKWKNHIKSMVQHSEKAVRMREELEEYLIKQGLQDDKTDGGCSLEDSIIDVTTQEFDYEGLIEEIEEKLVGSNKFYKRCSNPRCKNQNVNQKNFIKSPIIKTDYYCSKECMSEDVEGLADFIKINSR
jgi:hypothetical protein